MCKLCWTLLGTVVIAAIEELLVELSQVMNNCVACHAAYQIQSHESIAKD